MNYKIFKSDLRILKGYLKKCNKEKCFKETSHVSEDLDGHCCSSMAAILNMCDIGIDYDPTIRRYDLSIPARFSEDSTVCPATPIFFCPWCSTELPKSLEDKMGQILEEEYGITEPWEPEQEALISPEFKTDEWWKKRGL